MARLSPGWSDAPPSPPRPFVCVCVCILPVGRDMCLTFHSTQRGTGRGRQGKFAHESLLGIVQKMASGSCSPAPKASREKAEQEGCEKGARRVRKWRRVGARWDVGMEGTDWMTTNVLGSALRSLAGRQLSSHTHDRRQPLDPGGRPISYGLGPEPKSAEAGGRDVIGASAHRHRPLLRSLVLEYFFFMGGFALCLLSALSASQWPVMLSPCPIPSQCNPNSPPPFFSPFEEEYTHGAKSTNKQTTNKQEAYFFLIKNYEKEKKIGLKQHSARTGNGESRAAEEVTRNHGGHRSRRRARLPRSAA